MLAALAALFDYFWITSRSKSDEIAVMVGLGQGGMMIEGQRIYPVVDGPPFPGPRRLQPASLNAKGDGWTFDGKVVAIRLHVRHDPAFPMPIDGPTDYAVVDLGSEKTFGRALQAMRVLQRSGICDAILVDDVPLKVDDEEYPYPMLNLIDFAAVDGTRRACKWNSLFKHSGSSAPT